MALSLIIIDAANVVGSRPDGWWRDRAAANTRLRDRLSDLAESGLSRGPDWARVPPLEIVMVVEGRARGIASSSTVTIVDAPGSGDDTIAHLAADAVPGRNCLVVTSDRGLRDRVTSCGADVAPASTLALTTGVVTGCDQR